MPRRADHPFRVHPFVERDAPSMWACGHRWRYRSLDGRFHYFRSQLEARRAAREQSRALQASFLAAVRGDAPPAEPQLDAFASAPSTPA